MNLPKISSVDFIFKARKIKNFVELLKIIGERYARGRKIIKTILQGS